MTTEMEPTGLPDAAETVNSMIKRLFELWQLDDDQQAALLGLPSGSTAQLVCRGAGLEAGSGQSVSERAGHLLAIHASLRLLFPQNLDLAYGWMSAANGAFDGRTPIEVVREHGLGGLLMLRCYLSTRRA